MQRPTAMQRMLAAGLGVSVGVGILLIRPACPIWSVTGVPCPLCGGTRAVDALLHGDLAGALQQNALLPLWVLLFGALAVSLAAFAVGLRDEPEWLGRKLMNRVSGAHLAVLWIVGTGAGLWVHGFNHASVVGRFLRYLAG